MLSSSIWNDVFEVEFAEIKIKDTKCCILTRLIPCFRKLELMRNFLKWGRLIVHSAAIWNDVLEVETAKKIWKWARLIVHSSAIWNDVLGVWTAEKINK